jgi:hypothetical protein
LAIDSYLARVEVRGVEGITGELDTAAAADVLAALHEVGVVLACTSESQQRSKPLVLSPQPGEKLTGNLPDDIGRNVRERHLEICDLVRRKSWDWRLAFGVRFKIVKANITTQS